MPVLYQALTSETWRYCSMVRYSLEVFFGQGLILNYLSIIHNFLLSIIEGERPILCFQDIIVQYLEGVHTNDQSMKPAKSKLLVSILKFNFHPSWPFSLQIPPFHCSAKIST